MFKLVDELVNHWHRVFPIIDNSRDSSLDKALGTAETWLGSHIASCILNSSTLDDRVLLCMVAKTFIEAYSRLGV